MTSQLSFGLTVPKSEPRILVFDLETLRSADEVGGWSNIRKMGMAVGVLFDSSDQKYHFYEEPEVPQLIAHMRSADLVVGFNHVGFDYTVLSGYSDFDFALLPSFDILSDIKKILGFRLRLNSLVEATLGDQKSADGLISLKWVKEGRMDLVRDYCQKDVEVTKRLFEFGVNNGFLQYKREGVPCKIPVTWNPAELVKKARKQT